MPGAYLCGVTETSPKARGFETVCAIIPPSLFIYRLNFAASHEWHGVCTKAGVKNIAYTVESKSGAFVNARFRSMHHSAESRIGFMEVGLTCFVMAILVGFALVIVR